MMKRKTAISRKAKVSAPSVVDCGESADSQGHDEQGAVNPSLLVTSMRFSGVTAGSVIKLTVPVLPDLYLETITLVKGRATQAIMGKLSKGTPKKPGSATATIGAELYDFLLSRARVAKLLVVLEHEQTRLTKLRFEHV